MSKALNTRQERFAEFVASGMAAGPAYIKAGFVVSSEVAKVNASRLLTFANVKEKVRALRARTAVDEAFKREDMVALLVKSVKAPISKNNKATDRMAAARLLVDVMGWKEPETRIIETGAKTLESIAARAARVCSALDAWTNRKSGTSTTGGPHEWKA